MCIENEKFLLLQITIFQEFKNPMCVGLQKNKFFFFFLQIIFPTLIM